MDMLVMYNMYMCRCHAKDYYAQPPSSSTDQQKMTV